MPPDTIGRYRILRQLGAGGMGEVYLGEDPALNRLVAIKVLRAESGADRTADARLVQEARAAATLDHGNVCAIYEVGEDAGQHFIAMQYVEGPQLPAVTSLVLGVSAGIVTLMVLFVVVIALTAASRTPNGEYVVFARRVAVAAFAFASLPAAATMWLFDRYRGSLTAFDLALQRFAAGDTAR